MGTTKRNPPTVNRDSSVTFSLTKGYEATVDAVDADLAQLNWWVAEREFTCYAARSLQVNGKNITEFLHRVIFERMGGHLNPGETVDHEDNNGLNNRRGNLRAANPTQQVANRRITKRNKSGFKGVFWNKHNNNWAACIRIAGKNKWLGGYPTPEEAHDAYCKAASNLHREFARFD